jgi:hypothetical protein
VISKDCIHTIEDRKMLIHVTGLSSVIIPSFLAFDLKSKSEVTPIRTGVMIKKNSTCNLGTEGEFEESFENTVIWP